MLKIKLLHPDILMALGSNGHGAKVLIADGNFPLSTSTPANCKRVFLNLSPGVVSVTEVLKVIKEYIPIESGTIMVPPDESEQSIHIEFKEILGHDIVLKREKRADFYQEVKSEDTCLAIATGDTRRFANILLVMGTVKTI
jgi:L-fucose mutarotase